jgi:hypothetical protein
MVYYIIYLKVVAYPTSKRQRISHPYNSYCYPHLFFDYVLTKFLWGVIQLIFGFTKPQDIRHVYGGWSQIMDAKTKKIFVVGIGVMLWSIWLSRNNIVFNKKTNFILYADYVQGNSLDKNVGIIPKVRWSNGSLNCLLFNGDHDNRDFCKAWMMVY